MQDDIDRIIIAVRQQATELLEICARLEKERERLKERRPQALLAAPRVEPHQEPRPTPETAFTGKSPQDICEHVFEQRPPRTVPQLIISDGIAVRR